MWRDRLRAAYIFIPHGSRNRLILYILPSQNRFRFWELSINSPIPKCQRFVNHLTQKDQIWCGVPLNPQCGLDCHHSNTQSLSVLATIARFAVLLNLPSPSRGVLGNGPLFAPPLHRGGNIHRFAIFGHRATRQLHTALFQAIDNIIV